MTYIDYNNLEAEFSYLRGECSNVLVLMLLGIRFALISIAGLQNLSEFFFAGCVGFQLLE